MWLSVLILVLATFILISQTNFEAALIVLANFVGEWIVENIVVLEKRQSSDNESKSAFIKSTLFKVTNFILVLWIVNRESEEWFKTGGEAIGIAVMFSILASLLP